MPPQAPQDPFAEFVVAEDPFTEFLAHAQPEPSDAPPEQGSGGASLALGALRGVPAALQATARGVANHPSAVQKGIGAGMTALTSGLGYSVADIPGAIAGGFIRGLTPKQETIRRVSGRLAGESREVADDAARALGIQNYIKETSGVKVKPTDILSRPQGLPAGESYAKSQGRDLLKILGPDGNVVSGPTAPATPAKPRPSGRLLTRGASAVGRGLSALSGPVGITDLAQTIEPTRRDIGVMGIGKSVDVPGMHPTAFAQLRAAILAKLGIQP